MQLSKKYIIIFLSFSMIALWLGERLTFSHNLLIFISRALLFSVTQFAIKDSSFYKYFKSSNFVRFFSADPTNPNELQFNKFNAYFKITMLCSFHHILWCIGRVEQCIVVFWQVCRFLIIFESLTFIFFHNICNKLSRKLPLYDL